MKKLILDSHLSLSDVVCMTAAVRELHRQFPGEYATDVRTPFPAVWQFNPDITPIKDDDQEATKIKLNYHENPYVSVHKSNQHPIHLIEGYCQSLADQLQIPSLRPQELKGHIHLSADGKAERGQDWVRTLFAVVPLVAWCFQG